MGTALIVLKYDGRIVLLKADSIVPPTAMDAWISVVRGEHALDLNSEEVICASFYGPDEEALMASDLKALTAGARKKK